MSLAARIRFLRERMQQTQKQFADSLGLDVQTISCYERGKLVPRPKKVELIAEKCGVNTAWLLSGLGTIASEPDNKDKLELQEILEHLERNPKERRLVLKLIRASKMRTEAAAAFKIGKLKAREA